MKKYLAGITIALMLGGTSVHAHGPRYRPQVSAQIFIPGPVVYGQIGIGYPGPYGRPIPHFGYPAPIYNGTMFGAMPGPYTLPSRSPNVIYIERQDIPRHKYSKPQEETDEDF